MPSQSQKNMRSKIARLAQKRASSSTKPSKTSLKKAAKLSIAKRGRVKAANLKGKMKRSKSSSKY